MVLEHVAPGLVQPGDDDQLVTNLHAQEGIDKLRFDLEPHIRAAFRSLPRRFFPRLQRRTNESNRLQRVRVHLLQHCSRFPRRNCVLNAPYRRESQENESIKFQHPCPQCFGTAMQAGKHQRSSKHQTPNGHQPPLKLGAWDFSRAWGLEFGAYREAVPLLSRLIARTTTIFSRHLLLNKKR